MRAQSKSVASRARAARARRRAASGSSSTRPTAAGQARPRRRAGTTPRSRRPAPPRPARPPSTRPAPPRRPRPPARRCRTARSGWAARPRRPRRAGRPARRPGRGRGTARCAAPGARGQGHQLVRGRAGAGDQQPRARDGARRMRGSAAIRSWPPFWYSRRPKWTSSGSPSGACRARAAATAAGRHPPAPRGDPVGQHRDRRRVEVEQLGHLGPHRGRAGDHRVGPVGQPPLAGVHLAAQRAGQPAVVPPGLGGVQRRHQRHAQASASAIAGCATSQSWACTTSGRQPASRVSAARSMACPIASVQPSRSCSKVRCAGSSATASTRTPSTTVSLVGWLTASVPAGPAAQHDHLVPARGQPGGQRVHVPAEAADQHRRVLPRDAPARASGRSYRLPPAGPVGDPGRPEGLSPFR